MAVNVGIKASITTLTGRAVGWHVQRGHIYQLGLRGACGGLLARFVLKVQNIRCTFMREADRLIA